EPKRFGYIGDVVVVAFEFDDDDVALECLHALSQGPACQHGGTRWRSMRQGTTNDVQRYLAFGGKQHCPFDDVAQFANVSRPGISFQFVNRLRSKSKELPIILLANLAGEMLYKRCNILSTLTQCWQQQGKNVNSMKKILSKFALSYQGF